MCSTNPQILILICCILLHIHHIATIVFLIRSFLYFVAFVVKTLIFFKSEEICDFFDKRDYPILLNATFTICFFRNSRRWMSILICWIWICLENETQFILLPFYLHYPSRFSCNLPFSSPENLCFSKMLLIIVSIQYSPYINVLYDNN